jgi:hypothetical protein
VNVWRSITGLEVLLSTFTPTLAGARPASGELEIEGVEEEDDFATSGRGRLKG